MTTTTAARPKPEVGKVWHTKTLGPILVEEVKQRTSLSGPNYTVIIGTRVDGRPPR